MIEDIEEELRGLGFADIQAPEGTSPKFPSDVTSLGDPTIGQLYGEFMAWTGYCRYLLNMEEARVLRAKDELMMAVASAKASARETKVKAAEMKDLVAGDSHVIEAQEALSKAEIRKVVVEARFRHLENCSKALSRDMSRRQADQPGFPK